MAAADGVAESVEWEGHGATTTTATGSAEVLGPVGDEPGWGVVGAFRLGGEHVAQSGGQVGPAARGGQRDVAAHLGDAEQGEVVLGRQKMSI